MWGRNCSTPDAVVVVVVVVVVVCKLATPLRGKLFGSVRATNKVFLIWGGGRDKDMLALKCTCCNMCGKEEELRKRGVVSCRRRRPSDPRVFGTRTDPSPHTEEEESADLCEEGGQTQPNHL